MQDGEGGGVDEVRRRLGGKATDPRYRSKLNVELRHPREMQTRQSNESSKIKLEAETHCLRKTQARWMGEEGHWIEWGG